MSQVFNHAIFGGTNNLVTAGRDAHQDIDLDLGARFEALRRDLVDVGLSDEDVEGLRQALARDAADGQLDGQVGPATKGWLGGLAIRGAEVGSTATAGVVTGLVLKFLGAG